MSSTRQDKYHDFGVAELKYLLEFEAEAQQSREQYPAPPGWLEVMLSGQHTRDPILKTSTERRRDRRRASQLVERRRASAQHAG